MFDPTSRYYPLDEAIYVDEHGHHISYKRRRFLPQGIQMPLLTEVTVIVGDRLDLIAGRTLNAPDHFWRICDANDAMDPQEMLDEVANDPNRRLRIPQPQM